MILTAPHPLLSKVCRADFTITYDLIVKMFAAMRLADGVGLAAPQVGIDARLFITDWSEVFVNPRIESMEGFHWHLEGCLSLPNQAYRVKRATRVTMSTGAVYEGFQAFVIQHEYDHLDGRLISDG